MAGAVPGPGAADDVIIRDGTVKWQDADGVTHEQTLLWGSAVREMERLLSVWHQNPKKFRSLELSYTPAFVNTVRS